MAGRSRWPDLSRARRSLRRAARAGRGRAGWCQRRRERSGILKEESRNSFVEEEQLKAILESLLFAAGEPVSIMRLGNALESVPREEIKKALNEMAATYRNGGR